MSAHIIWGPTSRVSEIFPGVRVIAGKRYELSPVNPTLVRNTGQSRAKRDLAQLKYGNKEFTGRVVKYDTPQGYVYLVYERRVRPLYAMNASTGKHIRMRGPL